MSLADAITEVIANLRAIPGLSFVPDTPPEQVNVFPVCLVYARSGNHRPGAARGSGNNPVQWGLHTITIDVYVNHVDLTFDIPKVLPFVTSVPDRLIAGFLRDRFGGTVVTLGDPNVRGGTGGTGSIRYEFVTPEPGGLNAVGYRFELDVSIEAEVIV